jgi:O-acetyl-ADP-ribose deacetylase (regulator of RNase III)
VEPEHHPLVALGAAGSLGRHQEAFREVAKHGPIPLGGAVATSAGMLPFKAIIHVAGINMLWRASKFSVEESVKNAMGVAAGLRVQSIAFPIIGAGSGGFGEDQALALMRRVLEGLQSPIHVTVVRFR